MWKMCFSIRLVTRRSESSKEGEHMASSECSGWRGHCEARWDLPLTDAGTEDPTGTSKSYAHRLSEGGEQTQSQLSSNCTNEVVVRMYIRNLVVSC